MALQLVYTSAAKLLDAGRSGFGTVARSKTISPLVVSAIERVSQFSNLRGDDRTRMIFVHRRIIAANNRFHLLSRIRDAGADYTGRTHHIAHHLIVTQDEVARAAAGGITPADVLRQFAWMDRWEGAARFFGLSDDVPLEMFQPMGRNSKRGEWTRLTGNPALARTLAWEGAPRTGVLLVPREADPLALMSEALHEFGVQSWSRSFTTSLETTDEMSDIDWVISSPENFPEIQGRCGARTILDLRHPQTLTVPPEPVIKVSQRQTAAETLTRDPDAPHAPTFGDSAGTPGPQPGTVRGRTRYATPNRQAGRAPSLSSPKKNRNSWVIISALSLVAVALLGVLVWNIIPNNSGNNHSPDTVIKKTEATVPNQENTKRILEDAGMSKESTKLIIETTGDKSNAWANFIVQFIDRIASRSTTIAPGDFGEPPSRQIPMSAPEWLGLMVESGDLIIKYLKPSDEDVNLMERLNKLGDIHQKMKRLSEGISSKKLTEISCAEFDGMLVKIEIDKAMSADSGKKLVKQLINTDGSLGSGQFNYEKWPCRYKALCEIVRNNFDKFATNEMKEIIYNNPNIIKKEDSEQFAEAVDYWLNPKNQPSQKFLDELNSEPAFVPKNFGEKLKAKRDQSAQPSQAKNSEEPKKVETVSKDPIPQKQTPTIKAPHKQVILVSRDELKQGVVVELLKELLDAHSGIPSSIQDLTIDINGTNLDVKKLLLIEKEGYYSESWDHAQNANKIKIYKNRQLSIAQEDCASIKLNYKSSENTYESFVVVDIKNAKPLVENLKFGFDPQGDDAVIITGDISDWIGAVADKVCIVLDPLKGSPEFNKNTCCLSRKPQEILTIIITEPAQKQIKGILNKYEQVGLGTGKNQQDKYMLKQNKQNALNELKAELNQIIGSSLLSKELKIEPDKLFNVIYLDDAKKILKNTFKIEEQLTFKPANENDEKDATKKEKITKANTDGIIKEIIEKIGKQKLDDVLKKYGNESEGWIKLENKNTDAIIKCVDTLLNNTKLSVQRKPFATELKSIKSITVSTPSGRVLFKGTPN